MGGTVPTVSTRLWWRGPGEGSSWGQVRRVGCPGAGGGGLTLAQETPPRPGKLGRLVTASPTRACRASPSSDIVNKDAKSTLRVLYSLFCKHKLQGDMDRTPRAAPE